MEQRYGTDPSRRYGTGVWNGGMERVWSRSLFRTSYFDLHPNLFSSWGYLTACCSGTRVWLSLVIGMRGFQPLIFMQLTSQRHFFSNKGISMLVNLPCSKLQHLIPERPLVHVLLMDSFVTKCLDLSTGRLVCYVRLSRHPAEPRIPLQFKLQLKDRTFFFRPTPSWLSPGRLTRSISAKR